MKIISLYFVILISSGCSQNYTWGWYILNPFLDNGSTNLKFLLSGLNITIIISVLSIFISLLLGFLISLLGISKNRILNWINISYIEIFRSIPLLVLILWVYYGLPVVFGLSFGPFLVRIILPAIGNQFVYVLKMSSLVSIVGLADLTRKANELVVTVYRPLEIYSFLVLEYLILILLISFLVRKIEKKLKLDI